MKKIFFAMSMLALLYTSCDPSMDDASTGFMENVTAESVQASVKTVQVDGKNTNLVVVENHSPITQQWTADQLAEDATLSAKAYDTIYVTHTGENVIDMRCKNNAVDFTKSFTVNVDEIYYLSSELQKRLCVDTEKSKTGNYVSAIKSIKGQPVKFGMDFDPNKVHVTQEIGENGERGNKFTVVNENSVLSDWTISNDELGSATANQNSDGLLVGDAGYDYNLKLDYTKADGSKGTLDLGTYHVDKITTVPTLFTYLAGEDGTGTTWEWNPLAGNVWGNGNFSSDKQPSWWKVSYDDIDGQGSSRPGGVARNGKDAYLTFNWATKTATNTDGTTATFKANPLDHNPQGDKDWVDYGSITFYFSGNDYVVPMGVDVNSENQPFKKFYVVKAENKRLVLVAREFKIPGDNAGWYYMLRMKE